MQHIDRRSFLQTAAAAVVGAAAGGELARETLAESPRDRCLLDNRERAFETLELADRQLLGAEVESSAGASLARGVWQGALFKLSKLAFEKVADEIGLDLKKKWTHGDAQAVERWLEQNAAAYFARVVLLRPLQEEVLRAFPSLMMDLTGEQGDGWQLGTPTALVFALAHNLSFGPDARGTPIGGGYKYDATTLPAATFLAGLVYWHMQRNYGLAASVAGHMASNGLEQLWRCVDRFRDKTENLPPST